MKKPQNFNYLIQIIISSAILFGCILQLMSLPRVYLYLANTKAPANTIELLNAFIMGIRLDASFLSFLFMPIILLVSFAWLINFSQKYFYTFSRIYFIIAFSFLFIITFADLSYFSYFGTHATLMIFGVFDDDTDALIRTALANYNIPLITIISLLILSFLYYLVFKIIKPKSEPAKIFKDNVTYSYPKQFITFFLIIITTAVIARGSFSTFPLAHYVEDVSANPFINKLPQTAGFAIKNSYQLYKLSKSNQYDLIKRTGYENKIKQAFQIHQPNKKIDRNNLLSALNFQTNKNIIVQKRPPHVVLIMVESFGLPILDYQTESFNIMGRLKKHFDEDTLFTNIISSANGTIGSLEPLLLNITARPSATAFGQSRYLNTAFTQASARVYQQAGYETSFVYGGNLSWRNIGGFMKNQGFNHIEGKGSIANNLAMDIKKISHDWGVFDEYLYQHIKKKLAKATKPQFIFVLTTNNHPPYTIPHDYQSKSLILSEQLIAHITGNLKLADKRLHDYAYALDSLGGFMDTIKNTSLANNTVIGITADNNTIEGIMLYDNYYTQTKKIPFYLYLPPYLQNEKPKDTKVAGSHKDIFPTLYNLTLSEANYTAIGTDLLNNKAVHCGFNSAGIIMTKEGGFKMGAAQTDNQKTCQAYYNATLAVTEYLIKSHLPPSSSQFNNYKH